ncbi:hypothetical protein HNP40_001022 [Mycobacteroides chelonae]|nr:hypothetical protein [Mycobacteroides chelonae]
MRQASLKMRFGTGDLESRSCELNLGSLRIRIVTSHTSNRG